MQEKIPACKDFDYDFFFLHFFLLSPDMRGKIGSFLKQSTDFAALWSKSFYLRYRRSVMFGFILFLRRRCSC